MSSTNLDSLRTRFQAIAMPEEEWEQFIVAAAQDLIERRERQSAHWAAAQTEAQEALSGPHRPFAESNAEFLRRHNLRDLSHLPDEEIAANAERIVTAMEPQVRSSMEQEGLL